MSTPMLSADERAVCIVLAEALGTARIGSVLALLAAAGGLALLAFAPPEALGSRALLTAVLVPGVVVERWLAARVQLDAALFHRLGNGSLPSFALLDVGLAAVFDVQPGQTGRPLAARVQGARRLHRLHLLTAVALVGLAAAALGLR